MNFSLFSATAFGTWTIFFIGLLMGLMATMLFYWRKKNSQYDQLANLEKKSFSQEELLQRESSDLKVTKQTLIQLQEKTQAELIKLGQQIATLTAENDYLKATNSSLGQDKLKWLQENDKLSQTLSQAQQKMSSLEMEKVLLAEQLVTLRETIAEIRTQTKLEFENLANQILEKKSAAFNVQSEKSLDILLKPLKEKIQGFEKSVDEKYSFESKERHALKSEIERLINLNDRMTKETNSLTRALRGDSKVQGDWGELVLEKILEASGLREGQEYLIQKSVHNQEGDRFRPDIIINLPEDKHVIVDSKVSLKAYDLYRSNEDELLKTQYLNDHIKSLEKHLDDLSSKHYAKMKGINSPEFVFMFVPIEPAYLLAMHADPELLDRAWRKNVAFVTATTLLTSLKTVASIWRLEKQNKNALEIAKEGGKLYDKFVGFLEDFEKIGSTFDNGQKIYIQAMGKLKDGPGNVFRKIEHLKELGAAPQKKIPNELLE
jgi:DNA recombination protein RmuC